MSIRLRAHESDALPSSSCSGSLVGSSAFFAGGCVGYSVTGDGGPFGRPPATDRRLARTSLPVEHVESSFFADESAFRAGSVVFDHALVMRDLVHRWHQEADLSTGHAL